MNLQTVVHMVNKVNKHKFSPSSSPEGNCYMKTWEAFQKSKSLTSSTNTTTAVE